MNTQVSLSKFFSRGLFALFSAVVMMAASAKAAVITVPNGDFSNTLNYGSEGGLLITSYTDKQLGTSGPWRATGQGLGVISLVDVIAPVVTIGNGNLTFGSLVGVSTLIRNQATVFSNNIGTNFVTGQTYTLTVDFTANTTVNAALFSQAGFGISLRAAGSDVANSRTNPALAVEVFNGSSGTISLTYTATGGVNGSNIGVSLFNGQGSGLGNISLLNAVTFDNVTLTAVPEPASWAVIGGGMSLIVAVAVRRRRHTATKTAV